MTIPADASLRDLVDIEQLLDIEDEARDCPSHIGLGLKARLVISDTFALALGWSMGLLIPGFLMRESAVLLLGNATWALAGAAVSLAAIRTQQLYKARTCSIRTIEIQRLMRACGVGGAGVFFLAQALEQNVSVERITIASCIAFAALVAARSAYRSYLRGARRGGRHARRVVMIGNNEEAQDLLRVTQDHPEAGIVVVGALAHDALTSNVPIPHLGGPADALDVISKIGATGAIIVASSLPAAQLNPLVRRLLDAGIHVDVATGLRGIAHHRIRPTPLAHEPLLYLERLELSRWQLWTKRVLDVTVAVVALALAAPLIAVAAAAIRLQDGGPVLFRQERVGMQGRLFRVLKLRTMVLDAEASFDAVREHNERQDSPLFKMESDPRVTTVGRFLRATSIDELPQLVNVLRGQMSLVGPRPALPAEVQAFDEEHGARSMVRPGITGLWQVEARDNPAFGPYRRLDLFYIENWSMAFDLSILVATAAAVLGRGLRTLRSGRR